MSNRYCLSGVIAALVLALGVFGAKNLAAQTGVVTGVVTAAATGQPMHDVTVNLEGTNHGQLTNDVGRYVLQGVPVGVYTIRARVLGYAAMEREITVTPGSTLEMNFPLEVSAVAVDEIIVGGIMGATERRKLGVSFPTVDVDALKEQIPVGGFTQVLEGRVPGVRSMGTSGGVGSGRELRIRGTDSFGYTSQRPVIYIDGVRVDAEKEEWGWMRGVSCCYFSGGAGEDRLSDLNPEEIDRIEVLKGPAAATLFGAEASGGVIQVFTKRGKNETPPTFTLNSGLGRHRLRPNIPTTLKPNFGKMDREGNLEFPAWDPNEKLIQNGLINSYDLTISGGGKDVTYFVSTGLNYEEGSIKPNDQTRGNIRVNLNWTAAENLLIGVTSGFVRNKINVIQAGFNWNGVFTNALLSDPKAASDEQPYGGGLFGTKVEDAQAIETVSDTDRWSGRVQLNYTPSPTFTHQVTFGLDAVTDQKSRHMPYGRYYATIGEQGERNLGYRRSRKFTTDYLSTFDYDALFGLSFLTGSISAGAQGYWDIASMTIGTGRRYSAEGIKSISGATFTYSDEDYEENINVGFFVQNRFDLTEDLFFTAAVRADGNSAFGDNYGMQTYPKADIAYNLPQSFLPPLVSNLKLRAAVGMAGKAPGPFDKFQSYRPVTTLGDEPGVRVISAGNQDIAPENKRELETGIDVGLFDNKIGLELTYYDARVLNGLYASAVAASKGVNSRVENCCEYMNRGIETALSAALVTMPSFSWNMNLAYEWNRNRIISFGPQAQDDSLALYRQGEDGFWDQVGWRYNKRLGFSWWEQMSLDNIFFYDLAGYNPDLNVHQWTVHQFLRGLAQPRHMGSVFNTFKIGNDFRLSFQLRAEMGAAFLNGTKTYGNFYRAFDTYLGALDEDGFETFQSDSIRNYYQLFPLNYRDHVRLQDVSIVYTVPEGIAAKLGLQRTTVTFSGYNLHWWDDCDCLDPNIKFSADDDGWPSTRSLMGVPQPRRFLMSVRTRF